MTARPEPKGAPPRVLASLGVLLLAALALAPAAAGHALLQSSVPSAGSTVGTAPAMISLTFGERPDPRLSSVKVLDTAGRDHAAGHATASTSNPLELDVAVDPLPDGVYTVSWRTLSAVDGHAALGSFAFGIGVSPPRAGSAETAPAAGLAAASPSSAVARLLLYAGLIAMFGAGVVGLFIVPGRAASSARLGLGGSVLAAIGAAGVVAVQWSGAQADIGAILGTSLGLTGIARLVGGALGLVAGLAASRAAPAPASARPTHARPVALGAVTVVAGLAMAVDVVAGHAAAVQPAILQLAFQWFHVAAAGFWIGGLAALLASVRGAPADERAAAARRFSLVAGFAIAIVAVTGALRAIAEVGTLDALLSTDYGRLVIAKSALIVVLALLGATNHFWSVPVAGERFGRLRRLGTTELTVAMVAIALTAALVDLAPPISSGPPQAAAIQPAIVTGNDFGTSVRVRLVVSPGAPGANDFSAAVTDFDSGAPVDASDVSLRFDLASATGVGTSTLDLARTQPGSYAASGTNLSIDGIWRITATVTSSAGAVEVPLVVPTVVPDEPVDVNTSPGVPTIYVVHVADGRSVQVYLDPETAGKDEVHATFFDAAGTELPVAAATMAIAPASGPSQVLTTRQLEPGHYVADVQLAAGPLVVDVVGPEPTTGTPIHVHLSITVQP